jgi:hypothetical protein
MSGACLAQRPVRVVYGQALPKLNGGSTIHTGLSRLGDCSTLISGRSIEYLERRQSTLRSRLVHRKAAIRPGELRLESSRLI